MQRIIALHTQALAGTILKSAAVIAFTFALSTVNSADAALLHGDYSDIPPGAVMYLDVSEGSFTDPASLPLYGAPTASGNSLDFDPSGFGTSASGGAGDLVDGQLNFTLMALPGAGLTGFSIVEGGDFSFMGVTPSPGTFVSASAGATVSILEVDGVALASPLALFASDIFVTDYPTTGGAPATGLLPWSLVTFVDLSSVLPSGSLATKLEVAINNQLGATTSGPGAQAAIAKKDFKIIPVGDLIPDGVPEPSSFALACLVGMAGAASRRRR